MIGAILCDRHLQSVANYLILSLAVADLLVALLVMPLGAVYMVCKNYTFLAAFFHERPDIVRSFQMNLLSKHFEI